MDIRVAAALLWVLSILMVPTAHGQVDVTVGDSTYTKATLTGPGALLKGASTSQARLASHQQYVIPVAGSDVKVKLAMTLKWLDLPKAGDQALPNVGQRYFDAAYWVQGDDLKANPPAAQQFTVTAPWDWTAFTLDTPIRWETPLTLPAEDRNGRPVVRYCLTENRAMQIYHSGAAFDDFAVVIDDIGLFIGDDARNQTHNPGFDTGIAGWTAQGVGVSLSPAP